ALLPLSASLVALGASAQSQNPPHNPSNAPPQQTQSGPSSYVTPIGPSIGVDAAKRAATAASAEARKNGWFMAIAVVDPAGTLVYYEKADVTQLGSAVVAIDKARSAALYKRPTKAFEDALAKGGIGVRVLALKGAVPVDGGVPLLIDGKRVGAIGVSGDLSEHDAQCATAGADGGDGRRVDAAGALCAAAGSVGFGLLARGFASGILFQALLGAGIAGMYMPGLSLLSDRITGARQSRSIAFYTASFGVGTALSLALAGFIAPRAGWRAAFLVAGIGPVVAAALVL